MLKVFESFAGIGAQRKALDRLGIEHKVVGISEIDKYAVKSYTAIHGETPNYGDITKIDPKKLPDFNLFTYSFPCQDISIAGKQRGLNIAEGLTRSGLLYYALDIIKVKQPEFALFENVKNLVSKKFTKEFNELLAELEFMGYNTYWMVLNAKDCEVPQNRERVYGVSVRKDVDKHTFKFPEAVELTTKLKDLLEDEVDEKYFISGEKTLSLIEQYENELRIREATKKGYAVAEEGDSVNLQQPSSNTRRGRVGKGVAQTLDTGANQAVVIPCITPDRLEKRQNGRRFKEDGEPMFTLTSQDRHGILIVGRLEEINGHDICKRVYSPEGTSPTIPTGQSGNTTPKILNKLRIRKLTPLECWRLMDFDDEDFYKAKAARVSDSQLYKQAGNSIVVRVLEKIFKNLLEGY